MKKVISVDNTFSGMRIDRYLRKYFSSIPQSFIEKNLRNGKIKLNNKKAKSFTKIKKNDLIEIFNLKFEINSKIIKKKFKPTNNIIKENEEFIIENNDDFVVINKQSGISVQGRQIKKKFN